MNLQERKELLVRLGKFMITNDPDWQSTKEKAEQHNPWFTIEFINLAVENISNNYLKEDQLDQLINNYALAENNSLLKIGIVMAGNIPLVGFHDLLCTFITGNQAIIKASSKDDVLIGFLVNKIIEWQPAASSYFTFSSMLKECDAYIATGSNNTSGLFEYYFRNYPHIIRKNRTSVAILDGGETTEELEKLADDVYQYFGLGCRNVTKIFVPENYNFEKLLQVFKKYNHLADHHKYKNNYDYNLAIHLLNSRQYMSNESLLLVEDESVFSPISQLHYQFYSNSANLIDSLQNQGSIQCIVARNKIAFGKAQVPGICDYADGVDTMQFLIDLQQKKDVRKP